MMIIDLTPTASRYPLNGQWDAIERAFEYVEDTAPQPFTRTQLLKASGDVSAVRAVLRALLALDFAERIDPPRSRPMRYRLTDQGMPR